MKVGLGVCALLTLGLIACGGATGSTSVTGDTPAALRTAPAGVATFVFMDLEALRPDLLAQGGKLGGITPTTSNGVTTYNLANYTAANGGAASGTIQVSVSGTTFTETFNVTVTTNLQATATTLATTQVWKYTGTQQVTLTGTGTSAAVSAGSEVLPSLTAAFTDSATPANNKTYTYTANLGENWTITPPSFALTGTYAFNRTGETITGTIAGTNPLVWATCEYPTSGTLALGLLSSTAGTDALNVGFGPACGQVTIGGTAVTLGGN
jgi:hypothetical protein